MKKISGVYTKIISKENLYRSAHMAARGKRYRDTVADFNFSLEEEIDRLHQELRAKTYRHGQYRVFTIYDPKQRTIAAAPFRDRVVHHAAHDIIEPMIDKSFIHDSYACRKGRGTHTAVNRAQRFLRANEFCFHGDIKKYFPSIDHRVLKDILRARISDADLLWLLDAFIDSAVSLRASGSERSNPKNEIASGTAYPRNDEQKGLPIGNLTSQFFANLYLNELDYFIKFDLRLRYYLRYMDDFLIFGNDKEALVKIKRGTADFLKNRLALDMHEGKSQIYTTNSGIKFLGFRIFNDYRRLASDNVRRFKKRLKKFEYSLESGKSGNRKIRDSVRCWVAHSEYADTKALRGGIWRGLMVKRERLGILLKDILLDAPGEIR